VVEKRVPISASAGIGPTTPVTKLMTAADDAVVCVMLFSSALYGVRDPPEPPRRTRTQQSGRDAVCRR
jgi:hypothetical protein